MNGYTSFYEWMAPLAGRDLLCWCPRGQQCHGDALLVIANASSAEDAIEGLRELIRLWEWQDSEGRGL